ncbi:probable E3 SUMO-protein ligase RNF212 isoform X2 [Sus scrofa]|uniref:probable E3 SUMO-protein ligase RNF212 isoform X2 n=1 Tax=Sus scrofa TaxID=9823 RepID=UPI000A2B0E4A|nr:probable E3 SUMO-protein ligase RNF212 isoform X2 [Sus scrofa]
MAPWVFCNRCFQPPHRALGFSLTSCGHVYCDVCLRSGKRDECLICQVPCRTVLLSKHTDSDIQAFFGGIDGLCRKYARDTSQVLEFQDKHRRRLFAFYAEKISSLEESLRESALQVEQLSRVRWSQQAAFSTIKDLVSTPAAQPSCLPPDASASERVESMEVDLSPSPRRKVSAGWCSRRCASRARWGTSQPVFTVSGLGVSETLATWQVASPGTEMSQGTWPGLLSGGDVARVPWHQAGPPPRQGIQSRHPAFLPRGLASCRRGSVGTSCGGADNTVCPPPCEPAGPTLPTLGGPRQGTDPSNPA